MLVKNEDWNTLTASDVYNAFVIEEAIDGGDPKCIEFQEEFSEFFGAWCKHFCRSRTHVAVEDAAKIFFLPIDEDWLLDVLSNNDEWKAKEKKKEFYVETLDYKLGDIFETTSGTFQEDKFILSCIDNKKIELVCLKTGLRWSDPVEVTNIQKLTSNEVKKCFGLTGKFKHRPDLEIVTLLKEKQ